MNYINMEDKNQKLVEEMEKQLRAQNIPLIQTNEIEKVGGKIGEGNFGKVYKGLMNSSQMVAIKKLIIKEDYMEDEKIIKDTINEIKNVEFIKHESVPKFYGIWRRNSKLSLIFEFINGKTLKDVYKTLTNKEKLEVIYQVSKILEFFHSKNLIHRDIKPANVMIEENLKIKLIDFGISKIAERTSTFTANLAGTIRYMAPECTHITDKTSEKPFKIDQKIDIWSLGCMMSELFSHLIPWQEIKNEITLRRRLMNKKEFPIPTEIVDKEILNLIKRCVDLDPNNRISAGELCKEIEKIKN